MTEVERALQELMLTKEGTDLCMTMGKEWMRSNISHASMCFLSGLQSQYMSLDDSLFCVHFFSVHKKKKELILSLKCALQKNPEMYSAHILLGDIYVEEEEYFLAIASYEHALILDENNCAAYTKLAKTAFCIQEVELAKEFFLRSLQREEKQSDACHVLGLIFYREGNLDRAYELWSQSLEIHPTSLETLYNQARLCTEMIPPKWQEAREMLERGILYHPQAASLHNLMGHLFFMLGKPEEAVAAYQETIKYNPKLTSAYHQIALYAEEPLIEALQSWIALLDSETLQQEEKSHLAFAIATTYDRLGNTDAAFQYFSTANAMERAQFSFCIEDVEAQFDEQMRFFSQRPPPAIQKSTGPLFMVGMMRSGSTVLEQYLCQHSSIGSAGETDALLSSLHAIQSSSLADTSDVEMLEKQQHIVQLYQKKVQKHAPKSKWIIDKLLGNFIYIGWIRHLFPMARIVHCIRDPIDTCWSIFRHRFVGEHPYAYDLQELSQYYSLYSSLMEFWKQQYPNFILDVRYEDFVRNPRATYQSILTFCDIPNVQKEEETSKDIFIRTPSGIAARGEIVSTFVHRSDVYRSHLDALKLKEKKR